MIKKMINVVILLVLLLSSVVKISGQGYGKTLSPFLMECYSEPNLLDRNNLPPMTLPVMLDIIRKIEDHPNSVGDMRQISTAIIFKSVMINLIYNDEYKLSTRFRVKSEDPRQFHILVAIKNPLLYD